MGDHNQDQFSRGGQYTERYYSSLPTPASISSEQTSYTPGGCYPEQPPLQDSGSIWGPEPQTRHLLPTPSQYGVHDGQQPYETYQQCYIHESRRRASSSRDQYSSKEAVPNQALNRLSQARSYEGNPLPPPYQEYNAQRLFSDQPNSSLQQLLSSPNQSMSSASSSVRFPVNKLTKVIAIPATDATAGSPFLRAYPPVLQNFNIPQESFLEFIDRFNRAAVASPPVQILGLAGNIVSMVPLHTAQIVGGTINAASNFGSRAIAKGHTEMVLRDANRDIFEPRGLKVQVAKLDAVASIGRMPILTPGGKIEKHAAVLQPFESDDNYRFSTAQERRLKGLAPWIERLDVAGLPQLAEGSNMLSKMHASVSENQRRKGEEKMLKERGKIQKEFSKGSEKAQKEYEKKMAELDRDQSRAEGRRKDKDRQRDLRRVEERREKAEREFEHRMTRSEKERMKDDKEEKGLKKILFLIVTNLDGRVANM